MTRFAVLCGWVLVLPGCDSPGFRSRGGAPAQQTAQPTPQHPTGHTPPAAGASHGGKPSSSGKAPGPTAPATETHAPSPNPLPPPPPPPVSGTKP